MKKIIVIIVLFFVAHMNASINIVVFSYNRPLQLYAFLESFKKNVVGCDRITVVYRTSDDDYENGYTIVKDSFSDVEFYKQSQHAHDDFKKLTLQAIDFNNQEYILFAVDDIIVTRPVDLGYCTELLEKEDAYAFYLRLGKNITECYMTRCKTGNPPLKEIESGVYSWKINEGKGDWSYPHTLDMAIYRKRDIKKFFVVYPYRSPNSLEGNWADAVSKKIMNSRGLCFKNSCMVNCPLNIIQDVYPENRNSGSYTVEELLELFNHQLKCDIMPLQNCTYSAPHIDYHPTFIIR